MDTIPETGQYRVVLRRNLGAQVKPEAEAIDGKVFEFSVGWLITEDDSTLYVGEWAMLPDVFGGVYPMNAPCWIASGDLERIDH